MTNIGPITIDSVGGSAIVQFGPVQFISPKSVSKAWYGAGSSNSGSNINTYSGISFSNGVQG
ncbi:spore germination protein [Neobacillus sp. D3-1R]|uniref:spore germination protein n=1 Tax=Neobacillus sp. D3-1R TaxID=3445778 RepID=UPI003FA11268